MKFTSRHRRCPMIGDQGQRGDPSVFAMVVGDTKRNLILSMVTHIQLSVTHYAFFRCKMVIIYDTYFYRGGWGTILMCKLDGKIELHGFHIQKNKTKTHCQAI